MNNYYDEIELEYNCFLAEQELFDDLISLGSSIQHESVGLMLIKEDYNNSVNKYIEKIVAGIQKAWNNFKNKVIENPAKKILEGIKDRVNKYDGTQEVQYWHTYDFVKFEALKMVDFNLELIKSCENKMDYYDKAYPGFITDKEKSFKENIIDRIISTEETHVITQQEMLQMYDFCAKQFGNLTKKLEDDLKKINANINTLKTSINATKAGAEVTSTVSQQTALPAPQQQQSTGESYTSTELLSAFYESVLLEDKNDTKSTTVVKDTDADVDKEKANDQKSNIKCMNWYLAGNTDVFSVKMKILRQRFLDYIKIIKAVFPKEEKKEDENKEEVKVTTTNKQQIDINGNKK